VTAVRTEWAEVPAPAREAVETRLGATIAEAANQPGGFSHGVAARLQLGSPVDGGARRAFVKALPAGDHLADVLRNEIEVTEALPLGVPAPRLWFALEAHDWLLAVFDDVDGRHPDLADPAQLAAVLSTVDAMGRLLTPCPVPWAPAIAGKLGPAFGGWRQLREVGPAAELDAWQRAHIDKLVALEAGWVDATRGDTLLHLDLRADNLLRTPDGRIVAVDWAHPAVGARWVDAAGTVIASVLPVDVADRTLRTGTGLAGTDQAAIDTFLCALAGYWQRSSRLPAPPASPNLREHQRVRALAATRLLAHRTGWG
jgi:aminoglycoside phosphotransferase (APT) family kinase protein